MIALLLFFISVIGFSMFFMGYIDPFLHMILLDWMGVILMFIAPIGYIIRLNTSQTIKRFDPIKKNNALIDFLRRDGISVDVIGNRIYAGQSFLDVPALNGLIEDLGKDCVYMKGGKKMRYALENLSFTQDPRFWGFTSELYRLGFNDSDDLYNVLNGKDPELMAQIHMNMLKYEAEKGGERLLNEMKKTKPRIRIKFRIRKPKKIHPVIAQEIKEQVEHRHDDIDQFLEKLEREKKR